MSSDEAIKALILDYEDAMQEWAPEVRQEKQPILDAARQALERQRVPAGWVLAPVEPTFQMARAGGFSWESPPFPQRYKAMLAARPTPGDEDVTK